MMFCPHGTGFGIAMCKCLPLRMCASPVNVCQTVKVRTLALCRPLDSLQPIDPVANFMRQGAIEFSCPASVQGRSDRIFSRIACHKMSIRFQAFEFLRCMGIQRLGPGYLGANFNRFQNDRWPEKKTDPSLFGWSAAMASLPQTGLR